MRAAGLILAAGEGARYGLPKALVREDGRTWLEIALATLLEAGCAPVAVVLGAEAESARAQVRLDRLPAIGADAGRDGGLAVPARCGSRILWVENAAWSRGRTGSLQCGIRALPPDVHGTIVHTVDHPGVRPSTVAALVAAAIRQDGAPGAADAVARGPGESPSVASSGPVASPGSMADMIAIPTREGRRGHPIWIGRSLWSEVLALDSDGPLRDLIRRHADRVVEVPVDDPGVLQNRNEPFLPGRDTR